MIAWVDSYHNCNQIPFEATSNNSINVGLTTETQTTFILEIMIWFAAIFVCVSAKKNYYHALYTQQKVVLMQMLLWSVLKYQILFFAQKENDNVNLFHILFKVLMTIKPKIGD